MDLQEPDNFQDLPPADAYEGPIDAEDYLPATPDLSWYTVIVVSMDAMGFSGDPQRGTARVHLQSSDPDTAAADAEDLVRREDTYSPKLWRMCRAVFVTEGPQLDVRPKMLELENL